MLLLMNYPLFLQIKLMFLIYPFRIDRMFFHLSICVIRELVRWLQIDETGFHSLVYPPTSPYPKLMLSLFNHYPFYCYIYLK
jgi:hypothetical protein